DDIDIGLSEKIEQYLDDNKDLDAVICAEYGIARWLGKWKGITVCCIDEDYLSPGGPHFTHIKQNEKKIAFEAIRILLKQIEKDPSYSQMDRLVPGIFCEY
ncbi:hypothetical protein HP393_20900, partial [Clostridioides difficile]|nr:hypothetical protein [Clostridioides difficile]